MFLNKNGRNKSMKLQKMFLAALLGISLVGCSIIAESPKAEPISIKQHIAAQHKNWQKQETKAIVEKFKAEFEEKLNALKQAKSGEGNPGSDNTSDDDKEYFRQESEKKVDTAQFKLEDYVHKHLRDDNPLKYKELGILDEILDIVFNEKTGLTPNMLCHGWENGESLFFQAATKAILSEDEKDAKSAKILFKKLKKRGGDADAVLSDSLVNELLRDSTLGIVAKKASVRYETKVYCNLLCKQTSDDVLDEQEDDYKRTTCIRAKNIFAKMPPEQK
jgi:hypothetical protein